MLWLFASQDNASRSATIIDFQDCLQKLNQGQQIASGEKAVSILSDGQSVPQQIDVGLSVPSNLQPSSCRADESS